MERVVDKAKIDVGSDSAAWLIVAAAGLRTAFGVLMAIDAYLSVFSHDASKMAV